jgi:hypothetical protein
VRRAIVRGRSRHANRIVLYEYMCIYAYAESVITLYQPFAKNRLRPLPVVPPMGHDGCPHPFHSRRAAPKLSRGWLCTGEPRRP